MNDSDAHFDFTDVRRDIFHCGNGTDNHVNVSYNGDVMGEFEDENHYKQPCVTGNVLYNVRRPQHVSVRSSIKIYLDVKMSVYDPRLKYI